MSINVSIFERPIFYVFLSFDIRYFVKNFTLWFMSLEGDSQICQRITLYSVVSFLSNISFLLCSADHDFDFFVQMKYSLYCNVVIVEASVFCAFYAGRLLCIWNCFLYFKLFFRIDERPWRACVAFFRRVFFCGLHRWLLSV